MQSQAQTLLSASRLLVRGLLAFLSIIVSQTVAEVQIDLYNAAVRHMMMLDCVDVPNRFQLTCLQRWRLDTQLYFALAALP